MIKLKMELSQHGEISHISEMDVPACIRMDEIREIIAGEDGLLRRLARELIKAHRERNHKALDADIARREGTK